MKLSEKQRKFSVLLGRLIMLAHNEGIEFTIGHVWRSPEEQARLMKKKVSRTMRSKHLERLACDFNIYINEKYTSKRKDYIKLGLLAELIGLRWGGRFGIKKKDYGDKVGWDPGHVEYQEIKEHGGKQ